MPSETKRVAEYPEHEKLSAVRDRSQAVGEFLDWLRDRGIVLAEWSKRGNRVKVDELVLASGSIRDWLAEFFEIDQDKLEAEKRAMLDALHKRSA